MYFVNYGKLEFIPKEKYLSGDYSYVESMTKDGSLESIEAGDEMFDIVIDNDNHKYYYTVI